MSENAPSMELMHELLKKMNGTLVKLEEGQRVTNKRLGSLAFRFDNLVGIVNEG